MRILIAEDDFTSRYMLAAVLKKAGHEPEETVNGLEAWEALRQPDAPRLVILDWMMPEMDGLEVLRRVRAAETDRSPYIIMLTSKTDKAEIVAGLDAGADDYLAKPFDVGELRARVEVGRRMVEMQDALAGNIGELQQALAEIAAQKERLAVTLRSIGDGVITTDTSGNIVIMNKVAEDLTGWKLDEALGKPLATVFNIINENTRKPHENPVAKVLSSGQIVELANHTLLISRDGTERIIADSGAPIKDKDNKTIGVVLVFRDMTEKQQLQDSMQRAQKLESLGVLSGGIAHDFNNLMGGIFGYIDLAIAKSTEEEVIQRLSKAMNAIERARSLTGQLLTFAKGGAPIQKIAHLFPFVEETAKFALSGANVSCNFGVSQDLWACNFDKNQIGQVIDNLIINAQQAMPVGGTIEMSARNISLAEKRASGTGKRGLCQDIHKGFRYRHTQRLDCQNI